MVKVGPLCVDKYEASLWDSPDGGGVSYDDDDFYDIVGFPDNGNWVQPLFALSKAGVNCFLVGSALMREDDVEAATRALLAPAPPESARA